MPPPVTDVSEQDADAKVWFELEPEDDWPPAGTESLWALQVGVDLYELRNVPWVANGYAFGDVVRTVPGEDGEPVVVQQVEWSGRCTVRVIPLGDSPDEEAVHEVVHCFSGLGAECEGALPEYRLVALDIPPTADVARIKELLRDGEARERWGYDEGCIGDRWRSL
jgi:hypothetical protein